MIPKDTIDEIITTARVEEVVGDFVTLKKRGVNLLGLCPFHNEKTPSFTVSPAKGIYKCFGCGEGGNSVNFVMQHEHYSYPEALRYLAKKYNIEIEEEEQTPEQLEALNEKESLYIVNQFANETFQNDLKNHDEGIAIGLSYFKERGFREDIIDKFQLGYCLDQWERFTNLAQEKGYQLKYLEKAGLTKTNDRGSFDFYRGRVMFPIHNLTGRVIGFGGRTLKSDKKIAKYFNSPENEIYNKSKVLYGLYFAKSKIIANDNCYLVEGYTDVISMHQSEIENVVSSSGTSLTTDQIRLIKRYTSNITILFDGDAAGIKASFRGIDMILEEGMNVKVVLFPEGEDPDSYAKKNSSEELQDYLDKEAKDFMIFKTGILIKETQGDPVKRASLIKEIVASIALIPDQITRAVYTKECSLLMEISEQALINEVNKLRKVAFKKKLKKEREEYIPDLPPIDDYDYAKKVTQPEKDISHLEREILRLLLNYGHERIAIKTSNETGENEEETISIAHFIIRELAIDEINIETPPFNILYGVFAQYFNEGSFPGNEVFLNHKIQEIQEVSINLLSSPYQLSDNWTKHRIYTTTEDMRLNHTVEQAIYGLKSKRVQVMIAELQENLKTTADESQQIELMQFHQALLEVKKLINEQLGRIITP